MHGAAIKIQKLSLFFKTLKVMESYGNGKRIMKYHYVITECYVDASVIIYCQAVSMCTTFPDINKYYIVPTVCSYVFI
jgi:hypothetical protein